MSNLQVKYDELDPLLNKFKNRIDTLKPAIPTKLAR